MCYDDVRANTKERLKGARGGTIPSNEAHSFLQLKGRPRAISYSANIPMNMGCVGYIRCPGINGEIIPFAK